MTAVAFQAYLILAFCVGATLGALVVLAVMWATNWHDNDEYQDHVDWERLP